MNQDFFRAVVDTLIPGETVPGEAGLPALPSGRAAGVDLTPYAEAHGDVLRAIAVSAGGEDSFTATDEASRARLLQFIERDQPDGFRALVVQLLQDYYETDVVLTAMGWRTDPPQPAGHSLMRINTTTNAALARVKQKNKMWRG